jgi:hypothetical protein
VESTSHLGHAGKSSAPRQTWSNDAPKRVLAGMVDMRFAGFISAISDRGCNLHIFLHVSTESFITSNYLSTRPNATSVRYENQYTECLLSNIIRPQVSTRSTTTVDSASGASSKMKGNVRLSLENKVAKNCSQGSSLRRCPRMSTRDQRATVRRAAFWRWRWQGHMK